MITRFLDRFFPRRPDPLEPDMEFVDLLRAKRQEREDRLRRDTALQRCSEAIDDALKAAHELERMLGGTPEARPTRYARKVKLTSIRGGRS